VLALLWLTWLWYQAPRDRTVVIVVSASAAVSRVDVAWHDGDGLLRQASYHFDGRAVERRLERTTTLARGRYELELVLETTRGRLDRRHIIEVGSEDRMVVSAP
jgi:hypothetical protein